jgi:ABC-type sulfate/molybdate transport systems ATPase subunit
MKTSLRMIGANRVLGGKTVLRGIDLALEDGAFLVLAGESGSGKTTMLRMIAGLDRADAGSIEINGTLMDNATGVFVPAEHRGLGMVFQDFALWPHLSCLDNVALALPQAARRRDAAALALLERLGVGALAPRRPAQLSGGQQQRVGIARALAAKPKLLLLDEPLSSLDLATREHLREALSETVQAAGISAVLVSHDPEDCWKLADKVAVLEAGVIRQYGTPQELWEAPASPYIARFTGAVGGMLASVSAREGASVLELGDQKLVLHGKPIGSAGARLFWREDAITPAPDGRFLAEAVSVNFKAGRFWVRWRLNGMAAMLSGYAAASIPLGKQRIEIDPSKMFLFNESGALCE